MTIPQNTNGRTEPSVLIEDIEQALARIRELEQERDQLSLENERLSFLANEFRQEKEQWQQESARTDQELCAKRDKLNFIYDIIAVHYTIMSATQKISLIIVADELENTHPDAQGYRPLPMSRIFHRTGLGYKTFQRNVQTCTDQMSLFQKRHIHFNHGTKPSGERKVTE